MAGEAVRLFLVQDAVLLSARASCLRLRQPGTAAPKPEMANRIDIPLNLRQHFRREKDPVSEWS